MIAGYYNYFIILQILIYTYLLIVGVTGKEKESIITQAIHKLRDVNVRVVVVTCDDPSHTCLCLGNLVVA